MEEIIINGVNVAECKYMLNNKIKGKQHCPAKAMPYAKETSCICRKSIDTPYNFCKHNPNCHYKQLKRLEKENECLKEKLIIAQNSDNKTMEILQENAELKEKIAELQRKYSKQYQINENKGYLKAERILENYACFKVLDKINEVLNKGAEE